MLMGGEPVQLTDSYFPAELAEGSIIGHQDNITPGRIDADLKERFGLELAASKTSSPSACRQPRRSAAFDSARHAGGKPAVDLPRSHR
jgi:hypothetical protein